MKFVFFCILAFLSVIGIAHLVFEFCYRFFKVKGDNSYLIICPQKDNITGIEFSVRSAIFKMKKLFKKGVCDIIILSDNLDDDSFRELSLLQNDYGYLQILSKDDFIKKAGLQ